MSSPPLSPPSTPPSSRLGNGPTSASVTFDESAEHSPSSGNPSYVDAAGELVAGETDRLLPTATDPTPPVVPDAADCRVTSHEEKGMLSRFSSHLSAMHFTVPTIQLPSLPQYVTFDYPSLGRLGRVRLPEDEEATHDNEPNAPSRFTNYWTAIKKKQFRLRWWHYVLLVLVILAATVPPIVVAIVRRARRHSYRPVPTVLRCANPAELSLHLDQPYYRRGRQEYRRAASTSFSVPGDVANLQLNAFASHGSIRFVLDNSTDVANQTKRRNITIDVTAFMDDWPTFRQNIEVCRTGPWGWHGSTGLRIGSAHGGFMSRSLKTAFEVTVRLPAGSATSPTQLRSVSGALQDFEVIIDDLEGRVTFEDFSLSTRNMPIHAESLIATAALNLRTMNAPISGTFRAARIDINAYNGEIRANASVTMPSGPSYANGRFYASPYLKMTSTNRAIVANIDLVKSHASSRFEPVFPIEVRTSDAPIDLTIAAAEKTQLSVTTQNTFAPTTVTLPDTYIGDFSMNMNTWGGWNQPLAHFDQEHDRLGRAMRVTSLTDRGISGNIHLPDSPRNTFPLPGSRVVMSSQLGELDLYI
ncbi:uncharacterized protein B0H18DRAFT_1119882 [Fomitopsis serialis]|uniref:uncharacterized protein n=1 Tax=Fomitopsis serialis TaxID=139415 RepID=UPI002008918B|nr:uncharacterized protein B0H18DRAFT_1119882 [Neoantrodia serialis]KAH9924549.1 hypothetical protein B0H18DRAFT_1119882 [Neoantrodia serialis]